MAQVGSSVTVITSQQLEDEQRRTEPDLLKDVPGQLLSAGIA